MKTFKFRETLELIKRAILSQLLFQSKEKKNNIINKKDRCRDSKEAVLTNGVGLTVVLRILPSKLQSKKDEEYTKMINDTPNLFFIFFFSNFSKFFYISLNKNKFRIGNENIYSINSFYNRIRIDLWKN